MRYSIVYSSNTGNTRQLAEAIEQQLPTGDLLYCGAPDTAALQADVLFVGFWTDKGSCDAKVAELLKQTGGKTVYLFGTAGFGQSQQYFDQILARVRENLPAGAVYGGGYMCQGRMPQAVRSRYEAMQAKEPENTRYKMLIENFDEALAHPDTNDLEAAAAWAKGSLA
ncbi:MAG: flavodoxin family protein [Fournierella sp.]|uniref:flavodoxin family protein BilS n=1 Tax=Allofournierella sp. TaxID=1940256 RepID=UPI002A83E4F0|nr:flavodoxin family protein BilS [Fournierella sp.]MDY4167217.1 flavodoxin family protein [Fournierella sp.]